MRQRATGIIIENGKILLIHRIKPEQDYFIFPGGGVDEDETVEAALIREIKEELCLDVDKFHLLSVLENIEVPQMITIHPGNQSYYLFQIDEYSGIPKIGGPEKERINAENKYQIVWMNLDELKSKENIYPATVVKRLLDYTLNSCK